MKAIIIVLVLIILFVIGIYFYLLSETPEIPDWQTEIVPKEEQNQPAVIEFPEVNCEDCKG
ncbi:MAG: hypothetical protein QMD65_02075 [Patescibacteria group bacterium]|nr:hypothetical protein [Patescibacteria group bacterium]